MKTIDLNCDLGEGCPNDAELMQYITSANIACGGHAGDDTTMRRTVDLAIAHGVSIGAHPSFIDRENFGRVELHIPPAQLKAQIIEQIERLRSICGSVTHVKPHGALYNLAARDEQTARVIVEAIQAVDEKLILFALAGSVLVEVGNRAGLRIAREAFADRTYQPDGSLTPRSRADAMISDPEIARQHVLRIINEKHILATDGTSIPIDADTLCIHGDSPNAVAIARALRPVISR